MEEPIVCKYSTSEPRTWVQVEEYTRETRAGTIKVKPEFHWDGASTPRFVWSIMPTWGRWSGASLVHDWLYHHTIGSRKEADKIFYDLMREDGVDLIRSTLMYTAVRVLGWKPWYDVKFKNYLPFV